MHTYFYQYFVLANPAAQSCDFSAPTTCFIQNVGNDDFDWSFGSSTPSRNTGPTTAHDGQFAFIEASSPRRKGDTAILSTANTALPAGNLLKIITECYE